MALYHYKARAYDPVLGKFLQTDPVGYADGLNWYVYTNNDPLNASDPSGEYGVPGAVFGMIAGGVGAYIASGGDVKATFKGAVIGGVAGAVLGPVGGRIGAQVAQRAGMSVQGQLSTTLNALGRAVERGGASSLSSAGASAMGQVVGGVEAGHTVAEAASKIDGGAVLGAAIGGAVGGVLNNTHKGMTVVHQAVGAVDEGILAGAGELIGD